MRNLERRAGQRSSLLVAELLESADPVPPLMLTQDALGACVHGIPLDRLSLERLPFGSPVLEGAGLEIEIERLAIRSNRKEADRIGRIVAGQIPEPDTPQGCG